MTRLALRFSFMASTALALSACSAVGADTAPAPIAAPVEAAKPVAVRQHITQLPRVAVPSHYEVMVKPDAANLTFDGASTAHFTVVEPTSMITMQALELTFSGATLKAADGSSVALQIATDEANQTVTFVSTGIEVTGDTTARITGDLTLNGVTKPVVLDTVLNQKGDHPMANKPWMGFDATTTLVRSDFDLGMFAPFVGDEVKLQISMEAMKAE